MFDVAFADRAVSLPAHSTVVVADLHVGRADAAGVEVPLHEREDLVDRLSAVLDRFDPETVVVAGDVLHEFTRVSDRAAATLSALAGVCRDAGAQLELVAGNHDAMLPRIWEEEVHDVYLAGDDGSVVVCHGHEEPVLADDIDDTDGADADTALYVVGHDHPAITIEGQKRPCFLYGEGVYRGADLLMLPAFTRVAAGVTVNGMRSRDFQSPLVRDVDALRPVVWDASSAEALRFPPLGQFRRLL